MKKHIFVALLLSGVLVVPGFTQQTNSNGAASGQTAPAAQSTDSSGRELLKPETKTDFWDGWDPLESTCRHASLSIL